MTAKTELQAAFWSGIGVAVTVPLLLAFGAVIGSFPIMIGLGIAHREVAEQIPALGFWPVLGMSWGLSTLISKFKTKKFELFKNPKGEK